MFDKDKKQDQLPEDINNLPGAQSSPAQEPLQPQTPSAPGPDSRTFQEDMNRAMGSTEGGIPANMIEKARKEKEEEKIVSPKSPRNKVFIALSIILGLAAIVLILYIFTKPGNERIIEKETVDSLVYAEKHTGLNIADLPYDQIKDLVNLVVLDKQEPETVRHIYYLDQDLDQEEFALRRINTQEFLETIQTNEADKLADVLEEDFMHGIYSTDGDYPFLIFKTDSYIDAYAAMQKWEPSLADDIAMFMHFPPEVSTRKVNDQYKDEIIQNKPSRVLIFEPAEETISFKKIWDKIKNFIKFSEPVFAQEDTTTKNFTEAVFGTEIKDDLTYYCSLEKETDENRDKIKNYPNVLSLEELLKGKDGVFYDQNLYSCFPVLSPEKIEPEQLYTNGISEACFDPSTGLRRKLEEKQSGDLCIPAILCERGEPGKEVFLSSTALEDKCFVSIDIVSLEKINIQSCWSEDFNFVLNATTGLCASGFPTTPADFKNADGEFLVDSSFGTTSDQFESPYSIDNIRLILRRAGGYMAGGARIMRLLMLDKIPGIQNEKLVDDVIEISNILIDVSYRDILSIDQVRRVAQVAQRIETILKILEDLGVPDNVITDNLRQAIDVLKEVLGLDHMLGWITINGFLDLDKYATSDGYIYAGGVHQDVTIIQQTLFNVGLLAEETLDASGTLNIDTQEALRLLQSLNKLNITGVIDANTAILVSQIISAGQNILGAPYTLEVFGQLSVKDFLEQGGTLVLGDGTVITGAILEGIDVLEPGGIIDPDGELNSGDEIEVSDLDLSVEDFLDDGGNIYTKRRCIDEDEAGCNKYILTAEVTSPLWRNLERGMYGDDVQTAQVVLYDDGIDILDLNGIYDEDFEDSIREFQRKYGLEETGKIDDATLALINKMIEEKRLIKSGYYLNAEGFLEGFGNVKAQQREDLLLEAEAAGETLKPGDYILIYTFLDEKTLLIARHPSTIKEIIQRQADAQLFKQ